LGEAPEPVPAEDVPAQTSLETEKAAPPEEFEEAEAGEADSFDEVDLGSFFQDYLDPGYRTNEYEEYERPGFETFAVKPVSLYEHLLWQLGLNQTSPEVEAAAREIIGNLGSDGYLQLSLAELAGFCGCAESAVEQALTLVQGFDPPGVAARDTRECLLLQLKYWEQEETLAYRILEGHAALVETGDLAGLARETGATPAEIQEALERIRRLNPKPGLQYESDATIYVQPDVYIHKVGHDYLITLNEDGLPRLRISPYYRRMMESGGTSGAEKKFIREKFRNAVELIRNLDHRKRTIYRVCEIIIERQRAFLDNGLKHLKPMLLKDVAEELGLHTSTITRAVTNKWVHSPQGIMELRQLFTLGFKTDSGQEISIDSLKDKIRDLIGQEDPGNPLSDSDLTDLLNRRGIAIKRRTVAKYREEMHLPNSRYRRGNKQSKLEEP